MTSATSAASDPGQSMTINRQLLAQMDEAATGWEHWKLVLTAGMGYFTDAYDLFIIGVAVTMIKVNGASPATRRPWFPRWRC
jgi:MFS transporter, PHS family, inorganic phosphate transporter